MGIKKRISGLGRNVFFTGLVSLFMDISSEMVYPLVPLFLTGVLGASKTIVGVIEGIAEATASLLKIISGWLSDRFGKRKLLMTIGYGTSAASRPILAVAMTSTHVLGARFIDRLGKGIRTAPRDAIIAESTEVGNLGLAYGFHRSMDTVGAIIGPAIAVSLLYFFQNDMRLVFLASTIPGIIAVLLITFFIREKKKAVTESIRPPSLSVSEFNGAFRHYLMVIAVFSIGNFADAFLILKAESVGVAREYIPAIYLAFNIVYAASSIPMGALADKIGIKKMLILSFIVYSAVYGAVAAASTPWQIWLLFPAYGLYRGMSDGSQKAYLALISPTERKATAFGAYHAVTGLMLLPASIIAGYLWDSSGPSATFIYGSIMSALAVVIFIGWGRAGKQRRQES